MMDGGRGGLSLVEYYCHINETSGDLLVFEKPTAGQRNGVIIGMNST